MGTIKIFGMSHPGRVRAENQPEIGHISFVEGDVLMLCSDGLTDMLDIDCLENIFSRGEDLSRAAFRMIRKANDMGGNDNITVLLIKKEGEDYFYGDQKALE